MCTAAEPCRSRCSVCRQRKPARDDTPARRCTACRRAAPVCCSRGYKGAGNTHGGGTQAARTLRDPFGGGRNGACTHQFSAG
jgi:hypothetical protein